VIAHRYTDRGLVVLTDVIRCNEGLAVVLPDEVAARLGVAEGSGVNVTLAGDRVVLSVVQAAYSLGDLLVGMTPEAMRDAWDWGDDVGRERVR
jgi:antitoxin MazE